MNCPLPRYWMCHALVALLIALFLWPMVSFEAGLCTGAAFYVGREYTQWEQGDGPGLPFDWPGVLAPLLACLAALLALRLL
jgi:hypothetical protein